MVRTSSAVATWLMLLVLCVRPKQQQQQVQAFGVTPNQQHQPPRRGSLRCDTSRLLASQAQQEQHKEELDPQVAEKFKVITCMSTTCAKKRKVLNMDSLSTFGAMYSRIQEGRAPSVQVEEGPCLGACQFAPCVAVEHSDFEGSVSLEGMTPLEFEQRVFHNVLTEHDADRVWSCVDNAVETMQDMEEDDE